MRWFPTGRKQAQAAVRGPDDDDGELFDEHFQKRLEVLALVARRVFAGRSRAERRARQAGAGVEFADYREYHPGDDYRQVDWNVYGRSERLVLRLQEQEEDLSVYLLLDCSGSMALGTPQKLRYAKQLSAALAYVALSHLDRVSICALRAGELERLPPARGRNRIFTLFEFLRPLEAVGPTDLDAALAAFVAQNKRRGVAILLSDLYDPKGFELGVNRLRYARFETHVIHLRDPLEQSARSQGDVELIDVETSESRPATLTPRLVARYEQAYRAYLARIASFCRESRVGLHAVSTATPLEDAMLFLLRREGLVA